LRAWGDYEARLWGRAASLSKAALAVEPGTASARLVVAYLSRLEMTADSDAASWRRLADAFLAALDEKATIPASPREKAMARGDAGGALLMTKDAAADAQARDLLKKAVEDAALVGREEGLGFRYNLACAHGRLKEIDAAFEHVSPVLEEQAKRPMQGLAHWRVDPDFESLHADPRWAKLLEKYPPSGSGN
jgi:hypothetical protein